MDKDKKHIQDPLVSKEELEKEDREEYIPQELEFLSDVVEIED